MLFFDGREGRGMGDREKGRGGKKNKKIPRRTFDIFDADIASPFFSPLPSPFLPSRSLTFEKRFRSRAAAKPAYVPRIRT